MIVPTSDLYKLAYSKYAIGAYNISNLEQILGYLGDVCLEHFNVPAHLDFWCCRRSGASEILRDCGQALHKQEYVTAAKQMVDEILERAYRTCFFRFGTDFAENYCFQPSLFRGLAGIAYSALRSIAPGKYPSLVAFDLAR